MTTEYWSGVVSALLEYGRDVWCSDIDDQVGTGLVGTVTCSVGYVGCGGVGISVIKGLRIRCRNIFTPQVVAYQGAVADPVQ